MCSCLCVCECLCTVSVSVPVRVVFRLQLSMSSTTISFREGNWTSPLPVKCYLVHYNQDLNGVGALRCVRSGKPV